MIRRLVAAAVLVALLAVAAVFWWRAEQHYAWARSENWRWLLTADFDARARVTLDSDHGAWRLAADELPAAAVLAVAVARDRARLQALETAIAQGRHEPEENALRRLHRLRALLHPRRVVGAHELGEKATPSTFLLTAGGEDFADTAAWVKWREVPGFVLWRHKEAR